MAKELKVCCPDCGTFFSAEYGWWHKTQKCPKCKKKVDLREERMKTTECPHCKNSVVYDALNKKANVCPVCSNPLEHPVSDARYQEVSCPQCGVVTRVIPGSGQMHTCLLCEKVFDVDLELAKKELPGTDKPQLIEQTGSDEYVVWKHPLNVHSYQSRLKVKEGTTAICLVDGECRYPAYPGSHPLAESPLNDREKFEAAAKGEDVTFTTDIFFVSNRIPGEFPWGTMNPPTVRAVDGVTEATVRASGSVTLEISDAKTFLNKWGYRNHTAAELTNLATSPLVRLVRETIGATLSRCLQSLVSERGWDVLKIENYSYEVAEEAARLADRELENYGLQVERLSIPRMEAEETDASRARKASAAKVQDNLEALLRQVQTRIDWSSKPLHVHMRDNASLCADVTLGGCCTLILQDQNALLARPQVQSWVKSSASDAVVKSHLTETVNDLLMNVMYDVIQSMIDATNADVRELNRYFGHLRGTMAEYLNSSLKGWGLMVENFTLEQQQITLSAALSKMTAFASQKTEASIQQDMNNFTRNLEIEEEGANSAHRIHMRKISTNESIAMGEQDILEAQGRDNVADAMAHFTIKDLDREDMIQRHKADLQARREDEMSARRQERDLKALDYVAQLAERRGQISSEEKRRVFEETYNEWQRNARLEEAKLQSQMQANDAVQMHKLSAQRREYEAQHAAEQANADQRRILSEIMRKIDMSDFDWKQKQDAYERLLRNAQSEDYAANLVRETKAETDAEYLRSHLKVALSKEENDLLEQITQRAEDREERIRRNEFAREMEEKKMAIATQMQLLQMEAEQQDKANAAAERIAQQAAEIEKLQLTISHYEAIGRQQLDAARVQAAAETARKKAEMDYAERHEARVLNAESQRAREQKQRESEYASRAESLLKEMWSINTALEAMKLDNQREYNAGVARVEEVKASKVNESQLNSLTAAMEALAARMGDVEAAALAAQATSAAMPKTIDVKVTTQAPAQPVYQQPAPVYQPAPQPAYQPAQPAYQPAPQPGFQPGFQVAKINCPKCNAELSFGAAYCPVCHTTLTRY